jgi:hypothetical protein
MTEESRRALKTILSVLGGTTTAIAAGLILLLLFIASGLFGWTDGGEYAKRLEITTTISLILSITISSFLGGYVTARISSYKDKVDIILTAFVLLAIIIIANDFDFSSYFLEDFLYLAAVPVFVLIGGLVGLRQKKI